MEKCTPGQDFLHKLEPKNPASTPGTQDRKPVVLFHCNQSRMPHRNICSGSKRVRKGGKDIRVIAHSPEHVSEKGHTIQFETFR